MLTTSSIYILFIYYEKSYLQTEQVETLHGRNLKARYKQCFEGHMFNGESRFKQVTFRQNQANKVTAIHTEFY